MRKKRIIAFLTALFCLSGIQAFADTAPAVIMGGVYTSGNTGTEKAGPGGASAVSIGSEPAASASDATAAAASASAASASAASSAATPAGNTAAAGTPVMGLDISKLKIPESAGVLILAAGNRSENHAELKLLKKTAAQNGAAEWTEVLSTTAMIGMNGLYKEKEGDNRTPVGTFCMNTPFGIKSALPGFPSNYKKVGKNDYWNGDSESAGYNKLVDRSVNTAFSISKSEHLIDYAGYYNYGLDMGYNLAGTPYKGSALFLHCAVNGQATHGCIAVPEQDMITILKNYQEGKTWIVVYDKADPSAVCG